MKASDKELYSGLRNSTLGVIFMGTPHRGSHIAPLGTIIANIAKSLLLDISTTHLGELAPGSLDLEILTTKFSEIILCPTVEIVNFFETTKIKIGMSGILVSNGDLPWKVVLMRFQVVEKSSAILDLEASDHQAIPLHGNHRQICQFTSRDDSQYRLVKGCIVQILEKKSQKFSQDSPSQVDKFGNGMKFSTVLQLCSEDKYSAQPDVKSAISAMAEFSNSY